MTSPSAARLQCSQVRCRGPMGLATHRCRDLAGSFDALLVILEVAESVPAYGAWPVAPSRPDARSPPPGTADKPLVEVHLSAWNRLHFMQLSDHQHSRRLQPVMPLSSGCWECARACVAPRKPLGKTSFFIGAGRGGCVRLLAETEDLGRMHITKARMMLTSTSREAGAISATWSAVCPLSGIDRGFLELRCRAAVREQG